MPDPQIIVNGQPHVFRDSESILLDWLREDLGLAGTKEGCAEGDCGACSVLIAPPAGGPPRPANACLLTTGQVAGLSITTVEGLGDHRRPHPFQAAIAKSGGTQCGFCTPGFVVAGAALLDQFDHPSVAAIHDAFAGNLCRCTGYRAIVQAVHDAAPVAEKLPVTPLAEAPKNCGSTMIPRTIPDAMECAAHHPNAQFIAGGTDLVLERQRRGNATAPLIVLNRIPDLTQVRATNGTLHIGAACPIEEALPHVESRWPQFGRVLRRFGSVQIRSQATLGGNLATASPIGDSAPCLIALDATIRLATRRGSRDIPAEEFITGYRRTKLAAGDLITEIRIPEPTPASTFRAWKVSKRYDQDISTLAGAFRIDRDESGHIVDARVVFGGMADRPLRCPPAEVALVAEDYGVAADAVITFYSPIDDVRGGAEYRRRAARGLVARMTHDLLGREHLEVVDL